MNSKLSYPGSLHNHTHYSNLRLRDCIIKEKDLIDYAIELGVENGFIQEGETATESFIPDFDMEGI